MRAGPSETLQNKLRRMRLERRPPGFLGMLRLVREMEACEATPNISQQFQVEEGACVDIGDLAAAQGAPIHEDTTQATPTHEDAAQATPAHEDHTKATKAHEDAAESAPVNKDAAKNTPAIEDFTEACPAREVSTETSTEGDADSASSERTTKDSPITQEDETSLIFAGLGHGVGPRGSNDEPEDQAQAGDQEAKESHEERLKPILEESENEDGFGEKSSPYILPGQIGSQGPVSSSPLGQQSPGGSGRPGQGNLLTQHGEQSPGKGLSSSNQTPEPPHHSQGALTTTISPSN